MAGKTKESLTRGLYAGEKGQAEDGVGPSRFMFLGTVSFAGPEVLAPGWEEEFCHLKKYTFKMT